MTREETRRENARRLAKKIGGKAKFARFVGIDPTQVSQLIGPKPTKNIGNSISHRIEQVFKFPAGYLDSDHPEIELDSKEGAPDQVESAPPGSRSDGWSELTRVDAAEHRLLALYRKADVRGKTEILSYAEEVAESAATDAPAVRPTFNS